MPAPVWLLSAVATFLVLAAPGRADPLKPRATLKHDAVVTSLAFSPDSKTLATGDKDSVVRLWDVNGAKEARQLQVAARPSEVLALAFRSDGKTLVAGNSNGSATLWRLTTDKKYHDVDPKPYRCLSLARDGTLAAVGRDGALGLWAPGWENPIKDSKLAGTVWHTALSPDGTIVAAIHGLVANNEQVSVFDAATGVKARNFAVRAQRLAFARDGKMFATWDQTRPLRLWEMVTQDQRTVLRKPANDVVFSPDSHYLAAADTESATIRIYDCRVSKEALVVLHGNEGTFHSLAFSPDGRMLAAASAERTVLLWDVPPRPAPVAKLAAEELEAQWKDLLNDDAEIAFGARNTLLDAPAHAVPFLRQRLPSALRVEPKRLALLLDELNARQFTVRDRATKELEQFGDVVEPALTELLKTKPPLEVVRRIEQILAHNKQRRISPEKQRVLRAVEVLEYADTADARLALEQFAKLMPETLLTQESRAAVKRLDRRAARP